MPTWIIDLMSGTVTDYVLVCLVFFSVFLYRKVMVFIGKYHQLDKLILLICWMSKLDLVNIHRNGDYEIKNPLNKPGEQNFGTWNDHCEDIKKRQAYSKLKELGYYHDSGLHGWLLMRPAKEENPLNKPSD